MRDSRGVARAVAGDLTGAIADFEAYIVRPVDPAGVPRRQGWIEQLKQGKNPFTRAALDAATEM